MSIPQHNNKSKVSILPIVIAFIAGAVFLLVSEQLYQSLWSSGATESIDSQQIRSRGDGFTSPLLECSDASPLRVDVFAKLETKLTSMVSDEIDADGFEASVYFRDLNNGGWLEVGSKDLYQPASLMKLPTLIAAYKKNDTTPGYFDELIEVGLPYGKQASQNIVTGEPLTEGENMKVADLVKRTAVYSDNMAHDNLLNTIGMAYIKTVLEDFGVPTLTNAQDYRISPRIYARFLRILYNATYLSKSSSESLLKNLSKSNFDKGLRAGVPKGTLVASKFGERVMEGTGEKSKYQLHDCGIVYTKRPYILCVMTKGTSFDFLYKKISDISKMVYDTMN